MGLRDIDFLSIYESSKGSIVDDFLVPTLNNAIFYDRGVGYFSSGWLREASSGMAHFAGNGGRARWITSPILDKADWDAIVKGDSLKADEYLKQLLWQQIDDLEKSLNEDTLTALSWMVADEIITFKIALPTQNLAGGDFHDKFGIFQDIFGDRISFSGSYNDSIKGSLNYESIKVFKSWEPSLRLFVEQDSNRFERLWNNNDYNVKVLDIPGAVKEKIIRFKERRERPYQLHKGYEGARQPRIPRHIFPRQYQLDAVKAWVDNQHRGIFDMATGTGKTNAALFCVMEVLKKDTDLLIIITCPYIHLVDQWMEDCSEFNMDAVICYESSAKWYKDLKDELQKLMIRKHLKMPGHSILVVIVSNSTFISQKFQTILNEVDLPIFLIVDEVHHFGSLKHLLKLPEKAQFRLGLSATPERWYDEEGTAALNNYFQGVVYSLDLLQAIYKYGVLCKYLYKIYTVELTKDEFEKFKSISIQIVQKFDEINQADVKEFENDESIAYLLRERANVLNNAAQKLPLLQKLLADQMDIEYALIYSSPEQIEHVNRILAEKHIISHQITYRETGDDRAKIISGFEKGVYKVITAIKCLDEGLDIPKIRLAFLLASTGNPREFIQRRGRILRRSENKGIATIIDFVAVPTFNPIDLEEKNLWVEKLILKREFSRLYYFANCAENKHEALLSVYDLARLYGVQDVLVGGP